MGDLERQELQKFQREATTSRGLSQTYLVISFQGQKEYAKKAENLLDFILSLRLAEG